MSLSKYHAFVIFLEQHKLKPLDKVVIKVRVFCSFWRKKHRLSLAKSDGDLEGIVLFHHFFSNSRFVGYQVADIHTFGQVVGIYLVGV